MNKIKALSRHASALFVASFAISEALAIEALSEGEMASVTGGDGLTLSLSAPQIGISTLRFCLDSSTSCSTAYTGNDASSLNLQNVTMRSVGMNGANLGVGNLGSTATIDVFNDPVANLPGMYIGVTWNRMRAQVDALGNGNIANSTGTYALDSSGSFILMGVGGPLNASRTDSKLYLAINDADFYWRQGAAGSPELLLSDIDFLWDMPQGRVGINGTDGLIIEGNVNFNLTFDLRYQFAPSVATAFTFDPLLDLPSVHYGWNGTLLNARVTAKEGGSWTGATTGGAAPNQLYDRTIKNNGITYSMRWDLEDATPAVGNTEFKVVLGYVGEPAAIEFGNWTKLPNTAQPVSQPALTTYGFDIPILAFDMLRATPGTGPGGLCWGANWEGPATSCEASVHGGQFLNLAPEDHSLAVIIRDGFLRAYSSSVRIVDPPNPTATYGWALIYTLGNIDGNLYFRPDTRTAGSVGVKMDLLFMSQTFDVFDDDVDGNTWEQGPNWGYGTHFMIADTDAQLGIGLVNASFLLMGDNQYINLVAAGFSVGDINETASPVRWHVKGMLGGGDIPNMNDMVKLANWDGNFEFDRFNLTLSPPTTGETYVGYSFTVRFANTNIANFSQNIAADGTDDGSYLSLSDPGRPTKDVRLADAKGWYAARNGRLQLYSDADTPGVNTPAQLVLQNDVLFGASVSNVATDVFQVGRVEFADRDLGTIVVPSGQWYLSIGLRPQ